MTLIKMAQAKCLRKVVNYMRNNNATFEQAVLKGSPEEGPRELMQTIKYMLFLNEIAFSQLVGDFKTLNLIFTSNIL